MLARGEIEARVKAVIEKNLGVEMSEITADMSFDDLGADSLDAVELVMALEEEFHLIISDDDAKNITTVMQAVEYIERVHSGNA